MTRALFIVNPAAGSAQFWKSFAAAGPWPEHWTIRQTQSRGHAAALALDGLVEGFSRIVAVGGDGTLSEAAHGLLQKRPLPAGFALAHFPAGSGCDFARHFGIPQNPARWRDYLENGRLGAVDAGRASWTELDGKAAERYFVNIAMAGLPGDIARSMERSGKPLGGTISYLAASLAHILGSKARAMRLTCDARAERSSKYHMLALANTKTTGGGMRIAPDASAEDGVMDFIGVGDMSRGRLLLSFPKIYSGTHLSVSGIENFRARWIEATSAENVRLNIDGEALGRLPARFEVLPGALPMVLP